MPALFGAACALTAGIFFLGGLDGLTIAFGAALLGVSIDYSIHVINHHTLHPEDTGADRTIHRLRPSLMLGAATTMASFAGLLFTTSPAFRELGFFSIIGIGASLVATLLFLPEFLSSGGHIPELSQRVAGALGHTVQSLHRHRTALGFTTFAVALAAVVALPRLVWVDDLSRLGNADPALIEEEARVRSRLPAFESGRFIIALAANEELALRKNDRVYSRLSPLAAEGTIGGIQSLHQLVRSQELQRRNLKVFRQHSDLGTRIDDVFHAAGFRRGRFRRVRHGSGLTTTASDIGRSATITTGLDSVDSGHAGRRRLRRDHVSARCPLGRRRASRYRRYRRRRAVRAEGLRQSSLRRVSRHDATPDPGRNRARRFRPAPAIQGLTSRRQQRSFRRCWSSSCCSDLFAAFEVETNLLHVISLMMVMGMGVDYGVFLVDTFGDTDAFAATMLSLLLSCLTTVFVFGTLAISEHPALRAIGITTGGGILLAFVFAPISLLISVPHRDDRTEHHPLC